MCSAYVDQEQKKIEPRRHEEHEEIYDSIVFFVFFAFFAIFASTSFDLTDQPTRSSGISVRCKIGASI